MKGNSRVVAHLQRLINAELGVVDLALIHARIYEDRGFGKLAARADAAVQDARDGLDQLLRRALFLGTTPDMSQREPVVPASAVPEMLRKDLSRQYHLVECLRTAISCCHEESDYQTGALLGQILLQAEERHAYWLEQQLGLIETIGLEPYLSVQV